MAFSTAYPTTLANLAAGNQPLSTVDSNFTPLYTGMCLLNTYSNYYADSGAANAYVVTLATNQTLVLAAGLQVAFLVAHTNTAASTLNVNASGAKNILNPDGSSLSAGQLVANGLAVVMYDGTQYQLLSVTGAFVSQQGAKVWCKAGITGAIDASYNMTSVTDNGTGDITFTIGVDFSSANWAFAISIIAASGVTNQYCNVVSSGQAAGTLRGNCRSEGVGGLSDPEKWSFTGHGAQ